MADGKVLEKWRANPAVRRERTRTYEITEIAEEYDPNSPRCEDTERRAI